MSNYYRSQSMWGQGLATPIVGRLILINVAVFVVQTLLHRVSSEPFIIENLFALRPSVVVGSGYVWQIGTYMFLHGSFMHLLWNMFILWMFGTQVEREMGERNFLRFYLMCGLGAGLLSMVFYFNGGVLGASGAIFGLYVAYALMFPDHRILLYFLFPIKAKYFVAGLAAINLFYGLTGSDGVAYFAHLGGAVTALVYFRTSLIQRARFSLGARRRWKSYVSERDRQQSAPETPDNGDNIDSILDKISSKGYENLSTTEKRILDNYSRKHREENER